MRLPFFTLFLCDLTLFSLFPTLVSSIHPHALSRRRDHNRSPVPHVLTSRQHHVARDLLDVCISVNVNLLADASQLLGLETVLGPLDLGTKIDLCLCLKDLDIYLETNDDVQGLVGLLGKNAVGALVTALINTSPDARKCTFPLHAHHTCNTHDPCHYECDPPYVLKGGACVCAPPHTSCNGVCGTFPQGCGSAAPRPVKTRANSIASLVQAKASCKPHETVCGISGQESALAFECIDVGSSTDSCGGCMTPHPFFEAEPIHHSSGKDCSTISKAKGTSCSEQSCVVHTCTSGWTPSLDRVSCVPVPSSSLKMRRAMKRSDSDTLNITAHANLDSNLISQVASVVQLVLSLAEAPIQPVSSNSHSNADMPGAEAISGLLADVNTATATLINSLTSPASLAAGVDALLNSSSLLRATLNDCNCIQLLGLLDMSKDVDDLLVATLALQTWCTHNVVGPIFTGGTIASSGHSVGTTALSSPTPPSSNTLPSSSDADIPLIVGLSKVVTGLGVLGPVNGVVAVDGLLGNGVDDTANGLLDVFNIGPRGVRRRTTGTGTVLSVGVPPAATQAPYTGTVLSVDVPTPVFTQAPPAPTPTSTPNSGDIPIVLGLSHLLDGVGPEDVDNLVDGLLDELDIGPNGVRRDSGQEKRQGSMKGRRQVTVNAGVTANLAGGLLAGIDKLAGISTAEVNALAGGSLAEVNALAGGSLAEVDALAGGLLPEIDNLVGLVLGLVAVQNVLPSAPSASTPATHTTSLFVGIPSHPSPVAVPVPSSSSSIINRSLVDTVVTAALGLLTIPTYAEFKSSVDALIAATATSLAALDGCLCAEEVYAYLFKVLGAAQALSSCQPPTSTPTSTSESSAGHQPLTIGLTKLLNGLGLNIEADAVVGNVLSDGLDNAANSLLDGLRIGPNGMRRRIVWAEHDS